MRSASQHRYRHCLRPRLRRDQRRRRRLRERHRQLEGTGGYLDVATDENERELLATVAEPDTLGARHRAMVRDGARWHRSRGHGRGGGEERQRRRRRSLRRRRRLPVRRRGDRLSGRWPQRVDTTAALRRTPCTRHTSTPSTAGRVRGLGDAGFLRGDRGREHPAARSARGVFDVSHMGEIETAGPAAGELLQRLLSNDLTEIAEPGAQYSSSAARTAACSTT